MSSSSPPPPQSIICSLYTDYILALLTSAIIEHTNKVIFLEDDDVAAIKDGSLAIHRIHRNVDDSTVREVITLKMEIQQIMKGENQGHSQTNVADVALPRHPPPPPPHL